MFNFKNRSEEGNGKYDKKYRKLRRRVLLLERAVEALLEDKTDYIQDDGAFNGQQVRQAIFLKLVEVSNLNLIIETGTRWGDTTAFMAKNTQEVPIYSSELLRKTFLTARERLKNYPSVRIKNCDSRVLIRELSNLQPESAGNTLFYLDAHWYADLPLAEECELIFSRWKQYIVLIDDFQVPHDSGYQYDEYGNGKDGELTLAYLKPVLDKYNPKIFFPSTRSSEESGARRGCVVFCDSNHTYKKLKSESLLLEYCLNESY